MRKLWTTEENNIIIKLRGQGATYKQIHEVMPYRSLRAVSVQGAKLCASKATNYWTPEEEDKLIKLRLESIPYKEIAEILGRTYSAVKTKGSGLIADSAKARPMNKTPSEVREKIIMSDLNDLEIDFIENGQEFFRF